MNTDQERADFEAWAEKRGVWPRLTHEEIFSAGYQAALQSQDREDAERLEWLLRKLPGDAIRYCVGVLDDTADAEEFRAAIDHARLAEGEGK